MGDVAFLQGLQRFSVALYLYEMTSVVFNYARRRKLE